ncbi:hypothetical protein DKX38_021937 [Salix brachista]|uniref:Leucine-rich repeat-containing N-terminal plant-type domain-containing protein n=1 Tax=Salix brachista TaxID=2182728 RepID=A0A5N5JYB2_9ROSI|nr:hypothetical protein DKX38_021937 [Salix brachista]
MKCCFRTPGPYWHPEIRGLRGTINNSLLELPHLDLSGDDFLGNPFPNFILDLSSLRYLNLSSNGFIATLSHQLWSLSRLQSLDLRKTAPTLSEPKHLDVGFNSLEGVISEAHILNLSKLQHLDLSDMVPGFPKWLASQTNLSELDISGARISDTIRGWFWNLSPNLSSLNLSNNQMSGMFPNYSSEYPLYIGSLSWFEALTLHSNSLSGKLPPSLNHCNMLIFLDPSVNGLSGEIPAWIGESLSSLIFLSLYSNEFSGIIQLHLCQLAKIQIFDLSVNNISGTIPKFLSNFTSMVKEGELENMIENSYAVSMTSGDCAEFVKKQFGWSNARKDCTQLQSFTASALIGNPSLCGAPNHPKMSLGSLPANDGGEENVDEFQKWFYTGMGIGFAVCSWGVSGYLPCRPFLSHKAGKLEILGILIKTEDLVSTWNSGDQAMY